MATLTPDQTKLTTLITKLTTDYSIKVAFPDCTDILLSQAKDDSSIKAIYDQYFVRSKHIIFTKNDIDKLKCIRSQDTDSATYEATKEPDAGCSCCLPENCTDLRGIRGSVQWFHDTSTIPVTMTDPTKLIKRLYIADVLWVYWMEEMGIFRVLAKIINDYAVKGEFPVDTNITIYPDRSQTDGMTSMIMEAITRQMKSGLASSINDRVSTYRRCLGWTNGIGRQQNVDTTVNNSFSLNFHKFISLAIDYYNQLRLSSAIQNTTSGSASISTIVGIETSLKLLKESFDSFGYGRNGNNTLNAIVYCISALDLIRNVKDYFRIPNKNIEDYVSASYNVLIEGKSLAE